jgi:DNA-binding MarR family transcriptional regulator
MVRDSFLTFRLDQLSQAAMAKASQVYKERLGLNIRELRVMRAIGDQPGLSSRSLSEATFIEQTLVSKHLRKLVDAGLVQRQLESADARRVALHLTAQGKAIRQDADRLGEEMERDFLSVLTQEELAQFNHCLVKLRRWGAS